MSWGAFLTFLAYNTDNFIVFQTKSSANRVMSGRNRHNFSTWGTFVVCSTPGTIYIATAKGRDRSLEFGPLRYPDVGGRRIQQD